MRDAIPLVVLICDANLAVRAQLAAELGRNADVLTVEVVEDLTSADRHLETEEREGREASGRTNTIFIDPLAFELDEVARFIFDTRDGRPEIVFVLYMNVEAAEKQRGLFYHGDRQRLKHYYKLDKAIPIEAFTDEVAAVVRTCQADLRWRMPREMLDRLFEERPASSDASDVTDVHERARSDARDALNAVQTQGRPDTVFLSYSFTEVEYGAAVTRYLRDIGFEVVTGERTNDYIGRVVIERIRECEYFLCIMTRRGAKVGGGYATSPWLLEEKGVALALNKPIVLMIEDGVDDFGRLQGDWQRIHFVAKAYMSAVMDAAEQLLSYSGRGQQAGMLRGGLRSARDPAGSVPPQMQS